MKNTTNAKLEFLDFFLNTTLIHMLFFLFLIDAYLIIPSIPQDLCFKQDGSFLQEKSPLSTNIIEDDTPSIAGNLESKGMIFSTFLGGGGSEYVTSTKIDEKGYIYITGFTSSFQFPTTPQSYCPNYVDGGDIFVSKLSPDGKELIYSTYIGGSDYDRSYSMDVDDYGCVYLTGVTESSDFPTSFSAYSSTYGGARDAFLLKLSVDGSNLVYSTYLGGGNREYGNSITVDKYHNPYIAGYTNSPDFPTTAGTFNQTHGGGSDVFVCKFAYDGDYPVFSTFLGGGDDDLAKSLLVDDSGGVLIAGVSDSYNYPTTSGCFNQTKGLGEDVFISKLSAEGDDLLFSTFLGGNSADSAESIALDGSNNVYITGYTLSTTFPTTKGVITPTKLVGYDCFISKFNPDCSKLKFSSFIGGEGNDEGYSVEVGDKGCVYIAGESSSDDFPTTPRAFDQYVEVSGDVFLLKLNQNAQSLIYSTLICGEAMDYARSVIPTSPQITYVSGSTYSKDFPVTTGAFNETQSGSYDAFISKLYIKEAIPPVWLEVPQNKTIYFEESFVYPLNVSDETELHRFWLNDEMNFHITQDGTIYNRGLLMKGNYSLTIYVNDTSGNTISSTIIVSVVEKNNPIEPIPEEDPFENPMLWGIIVGGAFLFFLLITNIFLRRDLKKLEKNFRIENQNQNLKGKESKSHSKKLTKGDILPKNKTHKKN